MLVLYRIVINQPLYTFSFLLHHKSTRALVSPECRQPVGLDIAYVRIAHHFLHSLRRFTCMIGGNCAEVMMKNVIVDGTVPKMSSDETDVAIYC